MSHKVDKSDMIEMSEIEMIYKMYSDVKSYIGGFNWCKGIINCWYDRGLPDKFGVFFVQMDVSDPSNIDEYVWVIVGDIPPAYIDVSAKNGAVALLYYVNLMEEWATNVLEGRSVETCIPVNAPSDSKFANMLMKRLTIIAEEFLVNYGDELEMS
jgi:hypothetical protein